MEVDDESLVADSSVGEPHKSEGQALDGATVLWVKGETKADAPDIKNLPLRAQETHTDPLCSNNGSGLTSVLKVHRGIQAGSVSNHSSQTECTSFETIKLQREINKFIEKIKDQEQTLRELKLRQSKAPFNLFEEKIQADPEVSTFYTGFRHVQLVGMFQFFISGLNPSEMLYSGTVAPPDRKLSTPLQEFILTLVLLRSGWLIEDAAYWFKLSPDLVRETVTTWILMMHRKFSALPSLIPSREKLKETLPERFRRLKNIRIIVEGVEISCQVPTDSSKLSYDSPSKEKNFKILLGCVPTGAITFVSHLFEGSISDEQLVLESGLVDLLEDDDVVLLNKGFTVKDITDQKAVDLRLPVYSCVRDELSPEGVVQSREIAECRISVEHGVRSLKEFRMLQAPIPSNLFHVASQAVRVCAYMTNFEPPLDI